MNPEPGLGQALGSCCWDESLSLCFREQKDFGREQLQQGWAFRKASYGLPENSLPQCPLSFLDLSFSATLLASCWNPLGLQPSAHLAPRV